MSSFFHVRKLSRSSCCSRRAHSAGQYFFSYKNVEKSIHIFLLFISLYTSHTHTRLCLDSLAPLIKEQPQHDSSSSTSRAKLSHFIRWNLNKTARSLAGWNTIPTICSTQCTLASNTPSSSLGWWDTTPPTLSVLGSRTSARRWLHGTALRAIRCIPPSSGATPAPSTPSSNWPANLKRAWMRSRTFAACLSQRIFPV